MYAVQNNTSECFTARLPLLNFILWLYELRPGTL